MRVSIIQTALTWEQPEKNREMLGSKMASLKGKTDLIVLPEMFTSGFSMSTKALAETMDGPTVRWMQEQAAHTGAAIVGSFICAEKSSFYNRLVWAAPEGRMFYYDKRHLFTLAGEHKFFTPGYQRIIIEWKGFRICPLICYDLRFPVWSRNQAVDGFDLLIYVANWPNRRSAHWKALLAARAIENQSFVVGVNVVGKDGNGLEYSGDSTIVDFSGQQIVQISDREDVFTAELLVDELRNYRQQLPFLDDSDIFKLI
jgi:omega-amidase